MPNSLCAWMRPRPLRLSRRLRWAMQLRSRGWGAPCSWDQGGWGALYNQDQGGWGVPHYQFLCLAANPQGKYTGTRVWGRSKEGWDCPAFIEDTIVALQACLPKTHQALMYPLQLLTGNVPLATMLEILATAQTQVVAGRELMSPSSIPSVSEMPAPLTGVKWQCHSFDQGVSTPRQEETTELDNTPEEPPHWKWKEERSVARSLKDNCWKAFSKESEHIRAARWDYYKIHHSNYEDKGSYELSSIFREMATSVYLMGSEVHEVQEVWTGQKDLRAIYWHDKNFPKNIHFFRVLPPTESPKIMGLRGVHSPKDLQWWCPVSFCLWCGKEGQSECMVVNHLWTSHYHLGLICSHCMEYFTHECWCHALALPAV